MKLIVFFLISVMSYSALAQLSTTMDPNMDSPRGTRDMQEEVRQLRMKLEDLEDNIASYATMKSPPEDAVEGKVIPVPENITNVGNAYNPEQYYFKAPKAGLYAFLAKLDCTSDYRGFYLVKNGAQKIALAHNDVDDHSLGTFVILSLKRDDKIDLRHATSQGRIDGGPESFFSAWWIGQEKSYGLKPEDLMI